MSASPTSDTRDTRAVGALLALGLDVAFLMGAFALVLASVTPALGLVFAAAGGLVVAPLFGWHYAPRAGHRPDRSRVTALRPLAFIDALVVVAWVAFGFTVPVDGGLVLLSCNGTTMSGDTATAIPSWVAVWSAASGLRSFGDGTAMGIEAGWALWTGADANGHAALVGVPLSALR